MREVDRELVRRAVKSTSRKDQGTRQILLVDSREACALEAGELIDAGVQGSQITEIGELVTFEESGGLILKSISALDDQVDGWRDEGGPITMFKSVGLGLQDVAIACAVVAKAEEMGVGMKMAGYDDI